MTQFAEIRGAKLSSNVTNVGEARRRRPTPTGRALFGHMELASYLSPYGPKPPSEELLEDMLALPYPDRRELAEIVGAMALKASKRSQAGWRLGPSSGSGP